MWDREGMEGGTMYSQTAVSGKAVVTGAGGADIGQKLLLVGTTRVHLSEIET